MESDQYLQPLRDFIAGGLQHPSSCRPQLLWLLVLLEEVYETGDSIPLLTEKRETIQSVIRLLITLQFIVSGSVGGIVRSVSSILQHASETVVLLSLSHSQTDDTIRGSLSILLILIPNNDLSSILDVSMVESLFRLINDYNSPLR